MAYLLFRKHHTIERRMIMNDWYERSMKALQLNGLSKGTQEC
jgi:hypothetical protein